MKGVIGITGASGALYARLAIRELLRDDRITELAVIVSDSGQQVVRYEGVELPGPQDDPRLKFYSPADLFAPPASGSAGYGFMAVVPCSVGTAGRIAAGVSDSLLTRAADVMLKERGKLCLVVRETPLSLIHLRNLAELTEAGAMVMPASPSFYSRPQDIEQLCLTVVHRMVHYLTGHSDGYRWDGAE
ncbi:MAG: UbiX family flavin prenyltransferase [Alistipes sp.]|nr:UbiX family flavin prenyltransferase [Alistipes sp.]